MYRPKTVIPPARATREPVVKTGLDWSAAGWAGLVAGAVFLALQTALSGHGFRLIASVALGGSVMAESAGFSAVVVLAAAAVHIPLSLIYARVIAIIVDGRPQGFAAAAGAVMGCALYGLNFYAFANFFPWVAAARGPGSLAAHAAFGAISGGLYARLARRPSEER
ncbi:MAG: hypothetical protein M0D55_02745 [Elusimicrobiota bacterium]|nr:MAG: hypothetical protein M0D55_02745 [Elusimicrobiota bacterium]